MAIEAGDHTGPNARSGHEANPIGVERRLADLAECAEQELPCPPLVNLLVGGWVVQGRPASSRQFLEATHASLYHGVAGGPRQRQRFRGTEEERTQAIQDTVLPWLASVNSEPAVRYYFVEPP